MENEAGRGTMVGRGIDRTPERSRAVHRRTGLQVAAEAAESTALLQAISCSDVDRRNTIDPAQGTERRRATDGQRKGRDAGGIAGSAGAHAGVYRGDAGPRPQQVQQMRGIAGTLRKTVTTLHK